jgi:hypothetical protein
MAAVGSYLFTGSQARPPDKPSYAAGPVLDAIESTGQAGASIDALTGLTGFNQAFLIDALRELQRNGLTEEANGIYRLTDFGAKARFLVAR